MPDYYVSLSDEAQEQEHKSLLLQLQDLTNQLEERDETIRILNSEKRMLIMDQTKHKGGLQVRRESQSHVENLRDALNGLIWAVSEGQEILPALNFALKILDLTKGAAF